MFFHKIALLAIISIFSTNITAAEYHGRNIDGLNFDCTAFSYGTGKYYNVVVEFDGDEAIIKFRSGGRIRVTLDDEEIEDPTNISAFDYNRAVYWDLDIPDLED